MIKYVLTQDPPEYINRVKAKKRIYIYNPFLPKPTLEGPEGKETQDINLERIIKSKHIQSLYIPFASILTSKNSPAVSQLLGIIYDNWEILKEKELVLVASELNLHPEVENLCLLEIDEGLKEEEIREILQKADNVKDEQTEELVRAMKGLSGTEIHNILRSMRMVDPETVKKIKAKQIKKRTNLEYEEPQISFEQIGGNKNIKEYVKLLKASLNPKAERFGIKPPKGLIIVGPQGTAKSTMAKAIASELRIPYVKLQMGSFLSKYYGESESRLVTILKNINTISPCVVHIDEIDKVLKNTNQAHEATTRLAGILMEWMAEKDSYSPVIMTANYIENIDTEFRRAGRIDKIFYTWFPTEKERQSIWEIHLKLVKRNPNYFDLESLVEASENYTGAEIETTIQIALRKAFLQEREITTQDLIESLKEIIPIYKQKQSLFEEMLEQLKQFSPA